MDKYKGILIKTIITTLVYIIFMFIGELKKGNLSSNLIFSSILFFAVIFTLQSFLYKEPYRDKDKHKKNKRNIVIFKEELSYILADKSTVILAIVIGVYYITPGINIEDIKRWFNLFNIVTVIISIIILNVIRAAIRAGIFIIYTKSKFKDIKFGVEFRSMFLYIYANCRVPISISKYKRVLIFPNIIVGILPTLIGLILGNGTLIVIGVLITISGIADYELFNMLGHRKAEELVVSHPKEIGCIIVSNIDE